MMRIGILTFIHTYSHLFVESNQVWNYDAYYSKIFFPKNFVRQAKKVFYNLRLGNKELLSKVKNYFRSWL